jgi:hypothetical protein
VKGVAHYPYAYIAECKLLVRFLFHCIVAGIFGLSAVAAEIPEKNWENHLEIKKIRTLYNDINTTAKSNRFRKQAKRCVRDDGGGGGISQELYTDKSAFPRKYVVYGGSEDSYARAEYYYDTKGIVRFTYRYHGAVNGTTVEERIYFDQKGERLHQYRKEEGPGYPDSGFPGAVANPTFEYMTRCSAWGLSEAAGK